MRAWQYTKGVHDLGNGCYAYLQPNGTWGWSNAGLVRDGDETLLVDTLMDLRLTEEMLIAFRDAVPAAQRIGTLVNTHANPDHTYGNQLVKGATIVSSAACAEEMKETPPQMLAAMSKSWREMGDAGTFFHETMGNFRYDDVVLTFPTRTFEKELTFQVGRKEIRLFNVGPAHTRGDVIVYVPSDRIAFTGDILFIGGHPFVWAGPVDNWIAACEKILDWDVDVIVPGHGPITDKRGVTQVKEYLAFIKREAHKRFEAGLNYVEAANDITLEDYKRWTDPERIVANVATLYREFSASKEKPNVAEIFGAMGRYRTKRVRLSHGPE